MAKRFFQKLDARIERRLNVLTCDEVCGYYDSFASVLKQYSGNAEGFTGLSEVLLFEVLYHALGCSADHALPELTKNVAFSNNNGLELWRGTRVMDGPAAKLRPDIAIWNHREMLAAVEVKIYLKDGVAGSAAIVDRFLKMRASAPRCRCLLISYNDLDTRSVAVFDSFSEEHPWFSHMVLRNNPRKIRRQLSLRLGLSEVRTGSRIEA